MSLTLTFSQAYAVELEDWMRIWFKVDSSSRTPRMVEYMAHTHVSSVLEMSVCNIADAPKAGDLREDKISREEIAAVKLTNRPTKLAFSPEGARRAPSRLCRLRQAIRLWSRLEEPEERAFKHGETNEASLKHNAPDEGDQTRCFGRSHRATVVVAAEISATPQVRAHALTAPLAPHRPSSFHAGAPTHRHARSAKQPRTYRTPSPCDALAAQMPARLALFSCVRLTLPCHRRSAACMRACICYEQWRV
eukprot:5965739-Pleurochrysis_carterae.AAC.2